MHCVCSPARLQVKRLGSLYGEDTAAFVANAARNYTRFAEVTTPGEDQQYHTERKGDMSRIVPGGPPVVYMDAPQKYGLNGYHLHPCSVGRVLPPSKNTPPDQVLVLFPEGCPGGIRIPKVELATVDVHKRPSTNGMPVVASHGWWWAVLGMPVVFQGATHTGTATDDYGKKAAQVLPAGTVGFMAGPCGSKPHDCCTVRVWFRNFPRGLNAHRTRLRLLENNERSSLEYLLRHLEDRYSSATAMVVADAAALLGNRPAFDAVQIEMKVLLLRAPTWPRVRSCSFALFLG